MPKIAKITKCGECPNYGIIAETPVCKGAVREINLYAHIAFYSAPPEWCPLPEFPEAAKELRDVAERIDASTAPDYIAAEYLRRRADQIEQEGKR